MSKTNTRPSHGPAGGPGHGGPGRNLGVKGEKPKNFWERYADCLAICLNVWLRSSLYLY